MKTIVWLALIISYFGGTSFAQNDCKILSKKQAIKVKKLIDRSRYNPMLTIDQYCEACLDNYPQAIVVHNYSIKEIGKNQYHLRVNNRALDLTYFFAGGINLAQAVGCKTIAVSKYLE